MKEPQTQGFRHAVMAVAVAFLGAGIPGGLRGVAQRAAARLLNRLDERRVELDPDVRRTAVR